MKQFYLLTCICCFAFSQVLEAQPAILDTTVIHDSTNRCGFGPLSFTYTVDSAHPFVVHFIPSPNDTGFRYYWSFGDGAVDSTDQTPTHTYPSTTSTAYFVGLLRTRIGGSCTDRATQEIIVSGAPPPPPPSSCAVSLIEQRDTGSRYTFTATPTGQVRDSSFTYRWLINDTLVSTAASFAYTFPRAGAYQICVFQTSPDSGCNAGQCENLYVATDSTGGDTTVVPPPATCSVSFTYSIDSLRPNQVSFHATAYPASDSTIYYWVIVSDSSTTTPPITPVILSGSHPNYTFPDTGEYTVTLWTTAPDMCRANTAQDIRINRSGEDRLTAYPNPVRDIVHVNLILQKAGPIRITLFSALGNLMGAEQIGGVQGLNILSIPVKSLPTGIYFMHLQYGNTSSESRFQKL
jgi:hypothetical protein